MKSFKYVMIFILGVVVTIAYYSACANYAENQRKALISNESPKRNSDTLMVTIISPKLILHRLEEITVGTNDTLILENQQLLKCKTPYGIFYARYSGKDVENGLLAAQPPIDYCFDLTCIKDESSHYSAIISFVMRKAGHRN